jgi:phage shock protein E
MKIALLICIVLALSVACSRAGDANVAALDEGGILIDVRTAGEYNGGHLEHAILIPYDEIAKKIADHVKKKDERIVLYCRSGHRAGIAKKTLEKMGYTDVINAGSYRKLRTRQKTLAKNQATAADK